MIELRHLRQFVAVAEELHFGRAAVRLHMTQPPLTMAIRQLEGLLGAVLFVRTRRSVALSPAGEALLPRARRMLADADELAPAARAASQGMMGRLRLGFVSTVGYGDLPLWLRGFREAVPGVELALREATLDVQLTAFAAGEIDAGFVLHAPGERFAGFEQLRVASEPLVLALPGDHRLAAAAAVHAGAILGEPLVIFPRAISPSLYDAVLLFYRARQVAPRIAQEAIQMQTIVNLVSAGIGLAWVPESVTRLQRPGVAYRRVPDAGLAAETSLIWPAPVHPVVARFVEHVAGHLSPPACQGSR